jgi:hypothetical protein
MILLCLTILDEKLIMETIRITKNFLKKKEAKQGMLELEKAWKMGDQNDGC